MRRLCAAIAVALSFCITAAAAAQDTFEIQVYEWETVPRGLWNLETHYNFTARGSRLFEGTVAPTRHQSHLTFELTRGITDDFEMAAYLVTAYRPGDGGGAAFAGWRLRPRVKVPKSWNWPIDFSFSAEVGFPQAAYEDNVVTLELRPILEKKFGRWQFDVNPVFAHALRGAGGREGFEAEPSARVAFEYSKPVTFSVEYYGASGPLKHLPPVNEQVHQIYPNVDFNINEDVVWNLGVGWALTPAGAQLVYKTRFGVLFGR
ncbi:MAG: hypothetical protein M3081_22140 [Gemmatimonadota bacterium]|nr:hypothetical protein [Gemmatimonadota bacterium]